MGFLSIFTESSVLMMLVAFVFLVFGIRCLLYGIMGGTSTILRVLGAMVFIGVAYYFWRYSGTLHSANIIDSFVYDTWADIKRLVASMF